MLAYKLLTDENGFVVSAELILIASILVIGMIVGLSEVQHSVTAELNDVAEAVGSMNQSYYYSGFAAYKSYGNGVKSVTTGSAFFDSQDDCDNNQCTLSCESPISERPKDIERTCSRNGNNCAATCSRIN
jgi:hypothetical protein